MARPRKNAAKVQGSLLAPDEVAEIPVEEQPYPLPEGWKWVRLLSVFSNHTDSKKKLPQKEYLSTGTFPVVDQGKEIVGGYTENQSLLYSGPLPVIIFGDHTRCIKFIDFFFVQGADGIKVLHAKNIIIHKFFYYALKNLNMPDLGYRRHFPLFKKFVLPLPPLDEQQRIVDRIESLFAKLDEAKAKAEAVLDGFEIRKAAILHKAFTGELTKKWRTEQRIGMESWNVKRLIEISHFIKAGGDKPDDFQDDSDEKHSIPVVANGIDHDGIIGYTSWTKNYKDALTVAGRGTIGFPCWRNYNFFPVVRLIVIHPNTSIIIGKFLYYLFLAFPEKGTGSTIPQLTVPMVKTKEVPLCTLPEQQEIVRLLDSLLEKEQQAKEAAENVLSQIDLMKKAILARAFRGELGTHGALKNSPQ